MLEMAKPDDSHILVVLLKDHMTLPSKKNVCLNEEEETSTSTKTTSGRVSTCI